MLPRRSIRRPVQPDAGLERRRGIQGDGIGRTVRVQADRDPASSRAVMIKVTGESRQMASCPAEAVPMTDLVIVPILAVPLSDEGSQPARPCAGRWPVL